MSAIGKLWAGKIYGTNTGNIFAELENTDSGFTGLIRFCDDRFGVVVYEVTGTFDGATIEFKGDAKQHAEGVEVGTVSAKGSLTPEGTLRGQWSSTLGTGGAFLLFPHDAPNQERRTPGMPPERLHTATRQLGAIRLYTDDVVELIGFLARDFNSPRVIVTYHERGNEISRYASDFEKDLDRLGELRFLKLSVQEPEAYGINRLASIELNADGSNEVRVQGVQESWVIGKAEAVTAQLKLYEKALSSTFRKFGLNINGLLAIFALIVLPDLTLGRRAVFIAILALIILIIVQIHNRFIPNVAIYLSNRKPSSFERARPQIVSWLIAASSALVATVAYGLLKGELHDTIKWLVGAFG